MRRKDWKDAIPLIRKSNNLSYRASVTSCGGCSCGGCRSNSRTSNIGDADKLNEKHNKLNIINS
jgi:hypothetical protein